MRREDEARPQGGAATRGGRRPRRRRRRHGRGPSCRPMSRRRSASPARRRASERAARRRAATGRIDRDEMAPRRGEKRVGAGLRPVGRIGRRQFRLGAHHRAPDAAQKAEAIAADAFQRRLVAVGRADPGARFGDDEIAIEGARVIIGRSSRRRAPARPAAASLMTKSLPGMCGKPRKLATLRKLLAAGCVALVAARRHAERIADGDRAAARAARGRIRRLPPMRRCALTSTAIPALAPLDKGELAAGAEAIGKADAACRTPREPSVAATMPLSVNATERDAASRIAEIGRACRAKEPAALLVEAMHQPPHLGDEGTVAASDLADRAGIEKDALIGILEVDEHRSRRPHRRRAPPRCRPR